MNRRLTLRFVLGLVTLLSLGAVVSAGGGPLLTVRDWPDFAVAGKPLNVVFKAWVPSLEPLRGLGPVLHATDGRGHEVLVAAKAKSVPGEFTAALIFPEPGDWVIAFDVWQKNDATMPPLQVIAAGMPPPAALSPDTRGLRLFMVKGCNGCHIHPDIDGGSGYGPDLTDTHFSPDYLRRFLADPSITKVPDIVCTRDGLRCGSPYAMPDLDLKKAEIEAFVAFLTKK